MGTEVEYRPIEGFPGYRVGNDGSVWSCWEHAKGEGTRFQFIMSDKWVRIKSGKSKKYRTVTLSGGITKKVHRLVLEAFVGPCPEGMEACHGENGAYDDSVSNLRWDTHHANVLDMVKSGTIARGERSSRSKLTSEQIREIRREYSTGLFSCRELGRKYQTDSGNISRIVNKKRWNHVA